MRTRRDLIEARDAALARAEALLETARAETRDLTEAEVPDYNAALAEARRLDREIALAEERRASPAARAAEGGDRAAAEAEFRSILRGEVRAMSSAAGDPQGGHLVPEQIDRTLVNQLQELSTLRGLASVVSTATADYKVLVNRRGATSGWAGETATRGATGTPLLAEIAPPSGELYAYPSVSNWLLDDALVDVPAFLTENVSQEMALQEGAAFFNGDGTNKPRGFLDYATDAQGDVARPFGTLQHQLTGNATEFPASTAQDLLVDLMHTLRPSYRTGAVWIMNDETASFVRKLKDAEGRFLWADGLSEGVPSRLLGYPVQIAEEMPSIAADAPIIAFGNFARGYRIVDRTGLRVIRDEVTQPGWTKWYFARRVGGAVIDSNAIKLLKVGTE